MAPEVRLVITGNTVNSERYRRAFSGLIEAPSLLVSYAYLGGWLGARATIPHRSWVLDSGAFTAHQLGKPVDLAAYTDLAADLQKSDPKLAEVFALDVIGDWRETRKNVDSMWERGVRAIPTYHYGEPKEVLLGYAKDFPKIALGGVAKMRGPRKLEWSRACFAHVWPKKIHGFGYGHESLLNALPFHSADATSWEIRPARFGTWQAYRGTNLRFPKDLELRPEIEWYLKMERRLAYRWQREMALLEGT